MKRFSIGFSAARRRFAIAGMAALLGACSVIPRGAEPASRPVDPDPTPAPSASDLPEDATRHRIALLVPMSGSNGAVGQSIANATTMAILDTNAESIRITAYDTAGGAREAARRAVADGNKLILGPMLGGNIGPVLAEARPADIPLISFSNNATMASPDVFVMGHIPEQSIARSVSYAHSRGANHFAILAPDGEYGQRAEAALRETLLGFGGRLVATETYDRGNTSISSAAQRLAARGIYDAVVIADGARLAAQGAAALRSPGEGPRIIGTELWSGEASVTRSSALDGAVFSAVSDGRYKRFVESYEARFGSQPYRIATLGYDAVLLTLNVARDWRVGRSFPISALYEEGGFLGLDGAFRFSRGGVVQRAMEVREVRGNEVVIVSNAPQGFD
jgi:branched-chain amino acid transport system substrate-binding protein